MQIDYIELLKDSAKFSWKYKVLWVFGFILTILSGGSSGSNNYGSSNSDFSEQSSSTDAIDKITNSIKDFVRSPYFWISLVIVIIVFLLFTVVFWYLARVSKIALINSVKYDQEGKSNKIRLSTLWKSSHPYLLRFLKYDLVWFVLGLPLLIIIAAMVIPIFVIGPVGFISWCLTIPVLIILAVLSSAVKQTGEYLLIFENLQVIESIKQSWTLFKDNFAKYILAWATLLLPGCGLLIITGIFSAFTFVPLVLFSTMLIFNPDTAWIGIGIGGCGGIILSLLLAAVQSPFTVLKQTYWTKFMMLLFGTKFEKENVEEAKVVT